MGQGRQWGQSLRRLFKLKFRAHSLSLTSRLAGSPTLTLLARLLSGSPILWLAYVSGSPTYTRISTLARATLSLSLAYTTASPALSFASYLGHAPTTLTRTECFELRREPPLRLRNCRRRCGSSAGCADLAGLPNPHSARRARIHPSRAAGLGCAIAPLCLLLSSPASQPHSCRRASKSAALPAAPLVVAVAPHASPARSGRAARRASCSRDGQLHLTPSKTAVKG